jgi:hypothetical protein
MIATRNKASIGNGAGIVGTEIAVKFLDTDSNQYLCDTFTNDK